MPASCSSDTASRWTWYAGPLKPIQTASLESTCSVFDLPGDTPTAYHAGVPWRLAMLAAPTHISHCCDVQVYTSWLSRAIETAWLVLDELDALWLPLIKSWRLNERMYGALTGVSVVA